MKYTPLHAEHLALNAKMAEFAGYDMPIEYTGIREETLAVRQQVGMFDVSHMGEIRVKGAGSGAFLDHLLSRPVSGRKPIMVSYAILLYANGGAVDDLLAYRFGDEDFWLVVNASNKDKDFAYLQEQLAKWPEAHQIELIDESDLYGQIALQGPEAKNIMPKFLETLPGDAAFREAVLAQKPFRQANIEVPGETARLVISRTGYTGEDGFEIYLPAGLAVKAWKTLLEMGVKPTGLGARDALRLEAGMPLYGHEMSAEISPIEAGMGFACVLDRPFIAAEALNAPQKHRQIALISDGKAIAREHYEVFQNGEKIGELTSGSFSPTLEKGIAIALIPADYEEQGEQYEILVHRKMQPFHKVDLPFVKKENK